MQAGLNGAVVGAEAFMQGSAAPAIQSARTAACSSGAYGEV
jgi:hypothetical protein